MLRASTAVATAGTLACAFAFYAINYDTRRLEQRVQAQQHAVERQKGAIKVLQAERAYLARPERIEPLASALGMQPATPRQYVRLEDLLGRDNGPNDAWRPPLSAPENGPTLSR
jgi:cell division protein FtsL